MSLQPKDVNDWVQQGRGEEFRELWENMPIAPPRTPTILWPVCNRFGVPESGHPDNIRAFLSGSGHRVKFDTFANRAEIDGEPISDTKVTRLWVEIRRLGAVEHFDVFRRLVQDACHDDKFHPVKDYLERLTWDGVKRVETWLTTYLGVEDTELTRAYGTATLVGAVDRIYEPGCKFDTLLVLLSQREGKGKSLVVRALAGDEWFSDSASLGDDPKTVVENMSGKWIGEIPELSGMTNREMDAIKAQLSRSTDTATLKWEKFANDFPRQFIYIGTTNDERFLRSKFDNRRFWPVTVGEIDDKAVARDRDQLWAEALQLTKWGFASRFISSELFPKTNEGREGYTQSDPIEEMCQDWFSELCGRVRKEDVRTAIGNHSQLKGQPLDNEITQVMGNIGWKPDRQRFPRSGRKSPLSRCYSKPGSGDWYVWNPISREFERAPGFKLEVTEEVNA